MLRLRRLVAIIVIFWLLASVAVVPMYLGMARALIGPYRSGYDQARDATNQASQDVSELTNYIVAVEQAGTPISISDRLALSQARLAIAANAVALINYSVATLAMFLAIWFGLLGLALAVAVAIAS